MRSYDAAVIGGGPAGITAALYLLRSGASIVLVEKFAPGGQVLNTEWIDNYPGFPQGIKGYELVDLMANHLEGFSFDKLTDEVRSMDLSPGQHTLQVGEEAIQAKTVVICSGAEYRQLGLPGEQELGGKGVSYCGLCDGQFFRDQVIATIGGGDTALEESLYLAGLARKVYLIHRRDAFRGKKVYADKVRAQSNIELMLDTVPTAIQGEDEVNGLGIKNVKTGEESSLSVDGVFIFVGIKPQVHFVPESVERDEAGFIVTDTEMRTNVPGVFAAGDNRAKRCRQITTAVGDGAAAGHSAHIYLEEMPHG